MTFREALHDIALMLITAYIVWAAYELHEWDKWKHGQEMYQCGWDDASIAVNH